MTGWPRTLGWANFTRIDNPGPGQLVARNGQPIVARVGLSIMFYITNSPRSPDGRAFNTVDVAVVVHRLEYVPSRLPARDSDYYLRHEQGHLDLMGLFARELEVNLLALRGASMEDLTRQANTAVDEAVQQARMYAINTPQMDCIYDRDTNHGQLRPQQRTWNARIASNIARVRESNFAFRMG